MSNYEINPKIEVETINKKMTLEEAIGNHAAPLIKTIPAYCPADCTCRVNEIVIGEMQQAKIDFINKKISGVLVLLHQKDKLITEAMLNAKKLSLNFGDEYGSSMELSFHDCKIKKFELDINIDKIISQFEYVIEYGSYDI